MPGWPKFALFLSGLFFGGGMDHLIFIALKLPTSHYGLHVGTAGQLAFAMLDFALSALLYVVHLRGARSSQTVS